MENYLDNLDAMLSEGKSLRGRMTHLLRKMVEEFGKKSGDGYILAHDAESYDAHEARWTVLYTGNGYGLVKLRGIYVEDGDIFAVYYPDGEDEVEYTESYDMEALMDMLAEARDIVHTQESAGA